MSLVQGARVESSTISTAATPSAAMSGETAGEESSGPPVGAAIGMEEAPLLKLQSSGELKLSKGPSHRRKVPASPLVFCVKVWFKLKIGSIAVLYPGAPYQHCVYIL